MHPGFPAEARFGNNSLLPRDKHTHETEAFSPFRRGKAALKARQKATVHGLRPFRRGKAAVKKSFGQRSSRLTRPAPADRIILMRHITRI